MKKSLLIHKLHGVEYGLVDYDVVINSFVSLSCMIDYIEHVDQLYQNI
jgi:hypothetical protein